MWDAVGKNITREQVAPIAGTLPTVVVGNNDEAARAQLAGARARRSISSKTPRSE